MQTDGGTEILRESTNPTLALRPHPCSFPQPDSLSARGITYVLDHFLVDTLPANYPYLPFHHSTTSGKSQIPFFCFTGPDPPPTDIGSPGDIYVAPAASALYACLPVDRETGRDVWTRWSAVRPATEDAQEVKLLKLTEPGVFGHPYFPGRVLWPGKASFGWYALVSVNNRRREDRSRKLFANNEDVEAATKILVERMLQHQADPKTRKRRTSNDERDEYDLPRKKARTTGGTFKPFLTPEFSEGPRDTPSLKDWDAYYARPRNNTRTTKEIREQAATIADLEAENTALKAAHEEQETKVARLKAENAALLESRGGDIPKTKQQQQKQPRAAPERMPFHPEFMDFMRETFACEVMRTCNAQRVAAETAAADARVHIAALESKIAHLDDGDMDEVMDRHGDAPAADKQTPNAQLEAARARGGMDYTLQMQTAQPNVALRTSGTITTTPGLENKIKELQAENERGGSSPFFTLHLIHPLNASAVKTAAAQDAAALRCARACISDQQSKIAALEADVARRAPDSMYLSLPFLTMAPPVTRSAENETDVLKRLLAARESSKELKCLLYRQSPD
ncbi:hypothetical protein MVEN_02406300 [Mycena venus]|uniref:Uncharacterized protein n=1 Tax=Mycena venus TaxID=2733690 RepID=A0A8H6X244_9AGAR|nr:hypothetical protein MVEN_02406300 [Mycena venus]